MHITECKGLLLLLVIVSHFPPSVVDRRIKLGWAAFEKLRSIFSAHLPVSEDESLTELLSNNTYSYFTLVYTHPNRKSRSALSSIALYFFVRAVLL